jgi:hypothetical protein
MKKDTIALEFMKIVLSNPERFNDYVEEDDIMGAIAKDAYLMADAMVNATTVKAVKKPRKTTVKAEMV